MSYLTYTIAQANGQPTINAASCYNSYYTYYVSWNTGTISDRSDAYCQGLTDPEDKYEQEQTDERNRLLAIILPSVLGGGCLICCCCAIIAAYFGGTRGYAYYLEERQKVNKSKRNNA